MSNLPFRCLDLLNFCGVVHNKLAVRTKLNAVFGAKRDVKMTTMSIQMMTMIGDDDNDDD